MVTEVEQPAQQSQVEQPTQQSQIVQTVRQDMEQARQEGPHGDETQQEGEVAAQGTQGTATTMKLGLQRLSNILSALLRLVRYIVETAVSLLQAVLLALR